MILEEMNVYLDTPQRYVGSVYDRLLYADQPLGWDILGTKETIEAATRETFISYLDAWYRPERIVVGVGGRIGDGLTSVSRSCSEASSRGTTGTPRPRSSSRPTALPSSCTRSSRSRRTSSSASAATRSGTPTATRSSSSPSCSAAECRRASSPRCARSAGSRYYVHAGSSVVHGRGHALLGRGGRRRPRRRGDHDDPRRAAQDRGRARTRRRAREGARVLEGPVRAPAREPAGDDPVRAPARGARGRDRGAGGALAAARRGHRRGRPARRPRSLRGTSGSIWRSSGRSTTPSASRSCSPPRPRRNLDSDLQSGELGRAWARCGRCPRYAAPRACRRCLGAALSPPSEPSHSSRGQTVDRGVPLEHRACRRPRPARWVRARVSSRASTAAFARCSSAS